MLFIRESAPANEPPEPAWKSFDSLKDAVSTMVDDSLAVAFHNARMRALRGGVEILELHHQRKATADAPRGQRPALDQVYGSTWITAGAGSVLFITGRAGDPAVSASVPSAPVSAAATIAPRMRPGW